MHKKLMPIGMLAGMALASAFPIAASAAPPAVTASYTAMYTAEAYGPVHPDQFSPAMDTYPVFSRPLVRAAHVSPSIGAIAPGLMPVTPPYSGLVLDAFGGLHVFNLATQSVPNVAGLGPYFPGHDIARDFVFLAPGGGYSPSGPFGGYVLDGYGGVHPFATQYYYGHSGLTLPPTPTQLAYFPGRDVARRIVVLSDNSSGYVLDAFGGIHPWTAGGTLPVAPAQYAYWPNQKLARDIWIDPTSTLSAVSGYVLDVYGGLHPFWGGTATAPADITQHPYFPGHDIARAMWFGTGATASSSTGYVLDGYGGTHPFASAGAPLPAPITDYAYWPGRDIAIALFGG